MGHLVLPGSQEPPPWADLSRQVESRPWVRGLQPSFWRSEKRPSLTDLSFLKQNMERLQASVSLEGLSWGKGDGWWVLSHYVKVRNCCFHPFYSFFHSSFIGFILFISEVLLHGQKLLSAGLCEWADCTENPWNRQMSSQEGLGDTPNFDSFSSSFFSLSFHATLFP